MMATWWSKTILVGGLTAIALLPIGALGTRFGLWDHMIGFALLQLGALLGVVGIVGGIPGIVVARRQSKSRDLWAVAGGMAASFAVVVFLGMLFLSALTAPLLHQVATNLEDPPEFIEIVALRGTDSNALEIDAGTIEPLQEEFYPWVQPLFLRATPAEAFAEALGVLEAMGLEVIAAHTDRGLSEAVDTTVWFGVKDDVALRVRAYPQGSVVDVRSVSRVGLSDVGANGQRVKEILRRLGGD